MRATRQGAGLAIFVASAIALSGCAGAAGAGGIAVAIGLLLALSGCYDAHGRRLVGPDAAPPDAGRTGDGGGDVDSGPGDAGTDQDRDGWTVGADCDDLDPSIHPGAVEQCTMSCDVAARDEDCDGRIDEDCRIALNCFYDADGDGYGSGFGPGPDCDDADPTIHPGAVDIACDGVDQDCDGADASPDDFGCMNGLWDAPEDDPERAA
jgi:hypothetical protein